MEILIHTSAPSGRKDDQRYARQAERYASFTTANRIDVERDVNVQHDQNDQNHGPVGPPSTDDAPQSLDASTSVPLFIDDTQLARTALESQLLTESLKQRIALPSDHSYQDDSASEQPEESSSVVTPMKPPRVERAINEEAETTPERTPEYSPATPQLRSPHVPLREALGLGVGYIGPSSGNQATYLSQGPIVNPRPNVSPQLTKMTHSSSWTGDDVASELPSTYSLSTENTSKGSYQNGSLDRVPHRSDTTFQAVDQAPALETHRALQQVTSAQDPATATHTGPEQHDKVAEDKPTPKVHSTINAQSPLITTPSPKILHQLADLPLSIHPPAPPTSLSPFQTHITPNLSHLATHSSLSERYTPSRQTRPLRPSERGYWSMNTSTWPANLQLEFWHFLSRVIENGSLGFGVWADRSETQSNGGEERGSGETTLTPSQMQISERDSSGEKGDELVQRTGLGRVKVFCWGEVVEHVYLVLYVASKSKAKRSEAVWLDAGGEVVVQMPSVT